MPKFLNNSDGTIKSKFQIGLGAESPTLSKEDGHLILNVPLRFTKQEGQEVIEPDHDEDAVTLGYLTRRLNQNYNDAIQYMNKVLNDLFNSGTKPPETENPDPDEPVTPPDNPGGISLGNVMLLPTDITELEDGAKYSLGILPRMKFIERIIFELHEPFTTASGDQYEIAIGTPADVTKFTPWLNITKLDDTALYEIMRSLTDDTEFIATLRKVVVEEPEPVPEFDVQFYTYGRDRIIDTVRKDASGRVISITVYCDDASHEEVLNTELFGEEIKGQGYMDFGINLPVQPGKTYRIIQNNPALAAYAEHDPNIALTDEGWLKVKEYEVSDDSEDFIYSFLLGHAAGENDYVHIWLYDVEDDEKALFSFHIKNEIELPVSVDEPEAVAYAMLRSAPAEPKFWCELIGSDEIVCTLNTSKGIDGDVDYYVLSGECHDHRDEFKSNLEFDESIPLSMIVLHMEHLTVGEQYHFTIMNPLFDHIAEKDWVLRDDLGRRYISVDTIAEAENTSIGIPFSEGNDYNIAIHVNDSQGHGHGFVFENHVKFINRPLVYDDGIMTLAEETAPIDKGRMSIRILSF